MTSHKLFRHVGIAAITSWLFITFFQSGSRPDEAEHCHAAWLMAVQGLRPFTDFFQHHSPMLWDVLALYFRLGGEGVEILFFGRFLALICVTAIVWTVWRLIRLTSSAEEAQIPFCVTVLLLGTANMMFFENFVIRPETLAAALFACSWLVFRTGTLSDKRVYERAVGSGVLLGLSLFCSPRFLLTAPLFLLGAVEAPTPKNYKALALLACGSAFAFLGYLYAEGYTLTEYYQWVVLFSAKLQKFGKAPSLRQFYWDRSFFSLAPLVLAGALFRFFRRQDTRDRRRHNFLFAAFLLSIVSGIALSYPHTFPQNFMPAILFFALALPEAWRHFEWKPVILEAPLTVVLVWSLCVMVSDFRTWFYKEKDLISVYIEKKVILREMAPGDTVLLPYDRHPIAAKDASYYAGYLEAADTRQQKFVAWAQTITDIPDFDLFGDLKRENPKLICPNSLKRAIPKEDRKELRKIRQIWYSHPYARDPRWEYSHIAVLQDKPVYLRIAKLAKKYVDPDEKDTETP